MPFLSNLLSIAISLFKELTPAKIIKMDIKANLEQVKKSFQNPNCKLVAVSKTKPLADLQAAYAAGIRDFGENKVQEIQAKQPEMPADTRWHMIGHLQSNKIKYIAPFIHLIHGVDSFKLLVEIDKQGKKIDRPIPVLLQIHIATEESKFGFDIDELETMLASPEFTNLTHVQIQGLMGMASFTENQEQIRTEFRGLKQLYEDLKKRALPSFVNLNELSMGMSGDYQIAQEEGSTMVRIGSSIFGARNYPNS
jgi:pyridoxal phosphate enzyme (YggS family)